MVPAFSLPTQTIFGAGARRELPRVCQTIRAEHALILYGSHSLERSGEIEALCLLLKSHGITPEPMFRKTIEPTLDEAVALAREITHAGVLVAIGGGSILDLAKAALNIDAIRARDGESVALTDYFPGGTGDIPPRRIPLVAIPTTAGTGSEVTPYASLQVRGSDNIMRKRSISSPYSSPDYAIIDPVLTYTCPLELTTAAGFDALAQAIESYWSKNAMPHSQVFSARAIGLLFRGLTAIAADLNDKHARHLLALGANFAGIGISTAQTTGVHATSYPLTIFFQIPHGHACALTLPSFIRYNSAYLKDKGRTVLKKLKSKSADEAAFKLEKLMAALRMKRRLSDYGIKRSDFDLIVANAFRPDRAGNNPVAYNAAGLTNILSKIY